MMLKIYRFICVLLLSASWGIPTAATTTCLLSDTVTEKSDTKLYSSREEARKALEKGDQPRFFSGVAVGVDVVGPIMRMASSRGQIEAMCRVNILETYFPILEIGMGECNHTDETSIVNYSTKSPYFRIGMDMNFAKNKLSGNRIFGGVRYGFTSFKYDVSSPGVYDPVWNTTIPYQVNDISAKKHWAELLFGIESRICSFVQLGWSVRYKFGISETSGSIGKPWYVSGYGRNKNGIFGATFNVIFEL